MWASMVLLLAGLSWYAITPSSSDITLGPVEAIDALLSGDPIGLIDLGILFLIATPLLRIVTALAVFAQTREWKFVLVSVCVLLIVTLAIFVKG